MSVPRLPATATFVGAALAFVGVSFAAGAPSPLFVLFQQEWQFPAWVLTIAFAIYAVTLLIALLIAGSLSDHIGRKPVLIAALVLEVVSMVMFVFAPDIGWIIAARALQGVATGAAMSTFSAAIGEYAPVRHRKLGTIITSLAPTAGLGIGALATGFAVQFSSEPSVIIFTFLAAVFLLGSLVVIFSPETISRRPGAVRSLIPRLSIPKAARREFVAAIPVHVSTWMLAGLVLGLAPSLDHAVFGVDSGLVNGILVSVQPIAAAVASLLFARMAARRAILIGSVAVLVGVSVMIVSIVTGIFPLLFVATVLGGAGFGASFSGALRIAAPLAQPHQRAELFAGIYLVSYLAYGVPALIAGELIGLVGLFATVIGYIVAIFIAAAIGLIAQARLARSEKVALALLESDAAAGSSAAVDSTAPAAVSALATAEQEDIVAA